MAIVRVHKTSSNQCFFALSFIDPTPSRFMKLDGSQVIFEISITPLFLSNLPYFNGIEQEIGLERKISKRTFDTYFSSEESSYLISPFIGGRIPLPLHAG